LRPEQTGPAGQNQYVTILSTMTVILKDRSARGGEFKRKPTVERNNDYSIFYDISAGIRDYPSFLFGTDFPFIGKSGENCRFIRLHSGRNLPENAIPCVL